MEQLTIFNDDSVEQKMIKKMINNILCIIDEYDVMADYRKDMLMFTVGWLSGHIKNNDE